MKPSKAVIAGAAVAGLLTGSFTARTYATSTSHNPGVSLQTMADPEKTPFPNTRAKDSTTARARAVARTGAKTTAKEKEVARPTALCQKSKRASNPFA